MTMITVRGISAEAHQRLREQAARHGRSMEAEAREILEAGVGMKDEDDLVAALRRFADEVRLTDSEFDQVFPPRSAEQQRSIDFG